MNNTNNFAFTIMKSAASFFDGLILSLIYLSFFIPPLLRFLMGIGRFICMPLSISFQAFRVALLWIECAYANFPNKKVINTVSDTLSMLAFAVAVIGNLVAPCIFAPIAPIIFSATCFFKTLFHLSLAIFYLSQSKQDLAFENAMIAAVGTFATIAITGVMVFGAIYCAPLGIIVGMFIAAMSAMEIISSINNMKKETVHMANKSSTNIYLMSMTLNKDNQINQVKVTREINYSNRFYNQSKTHAIPSQQPLFVPKRVALQTR